MQAYLTPFEFRKGIVAHALSLQTWDFRLLNLIQGKIMLMCLKYSIRKKYMSKLQP